MMGSVSATDAIQIPINGMFVMALTVLITIAVAVSFFSRWGKQVRAVVQNRVMAGAVGINTEGRPLHLRPRLRHRRHRGFCLHHDRLDRTDRRPALLVDTFLVVVFGARQACSAPLRPPSPSPRRSRRWVFLSGSMAKVITLLAIVGILMMRPQSSSRSRSPLRLGKHGHDHQLALLQPHRAQQGSPRWRGCSSSSCRCRSTSSASTWSPNISPTPLSRSGWCCAGAMAAF